MPENVRRLGQSKLEVGPIAYGLWRFTGDDVSSAHTRIETAIESGMTLIDVAAVYGLDWGGSSFGESEALLGKVFAATPHIRNGVGSGHQIGPLLNRPRCGLSPSAQPATSPPLGEKQSTPD